MEAYKELLHRIPRLRSIQETAASAARDPAAGNAKIRNGYVALSNAFGRLLHGDAAPENATFVTFAGWAAYSLRREIVRDVNAPTEGFHPARRSYRWIAREILGADDVIAHNIVRGQGAVYEEIASAIYKMMQLVLEELPSFDADPKTHAGRWECLWKEYNCSLKEMPTYLNRGRHESETLAPADVAILQRAVAPYFQVLTDGLSRAEVEGDDRKKRAELILLGTLRTLAYEQKRVQPVYQRNFSYVPDALREMLATRVLGRSPAWAHALRKPSERLQHVTSILDEAFQIAATRTVFSLALGTEDVGFGRDIPMPPPANPLLRDQQSPIDQERYGLGAFFPYDLQNFVHRPTWTAWQQYDRSSGQGARTAVNNWLRYGERLSFLANLFRSRQQLTALYDLPSALPPIAPPRTTRLGPASERLSDATQERLEQSFGAGA